MSLIYNFLIQVCRSAVGIWRVFRSIDTLLICVLAWESRIQWEFPQGGIKIECPMEWQFHVNIHSSSNVLQAVTLCACHVFSLKKNADLVGSKVLCYHECHLQVWNIWSKRVCEFSEIKFCPKPKKGSTFDGRGWAWLYIIDYSFLFTPFPSNSVPCYSKKSVAVSFQI